MDAIGALVLLLIVGVFKFLAAYWHILLALIIGYVIREFIEQADIPRRRALIENAIHGAYARAQNQAEDRHREEAEARESRIYEYVRSRIADKKHDAGIGFYSDIREVNGKRMSLSDYYSALYRAEAVVKEDGKVNMDLIRIETSLHRRAAA